MSILEMCVVVAIMLVLAGLAMPRVMTVMAETRLRGSAVETANFLQQARLRAIRNNRYVTVRYDAAKNFVYADTYNPAGQYIVAADGGSGDGVYNGPAQGEPVIVLGSNTRFLTAGNPAFLPTKIDAAGQVTQNDAPLRITWSARGMPCLPVAGGQTCQTARAFAYFLTDGTAGLNTGRWAAVTVSRSGRVKVWMWTGADWQ